VTTFAKIKKTGSFHGKSNKLGHGGRVAQMRAEGVPGGVIGEIARREGDQGDQSEQED